MSVKRKVKIKRVKRTRTAKKSLRSSKIPRGKTTLYHYVSLDNKKYLVDLSHTRGFSESKLLDVMLDGYRKNRVKLHFAL